MAELLLAGKFRAPAPRERLVGRSRLRERLAEAAHARLTLVSAPPGFGKSTLLAERSAAVGRGRSAWLSLDASDNDVRAFWAHLIQALATAVPDLGSEARALVESPDHPIQSGVTVLLNELAELSGDLELVLDDYHVLDVPEIHESVSYFLEHLPGPVHVVIATRADPPLPLARMRVRGELAEIRASDLRFTAEETERYLNGSLQLGLAPSDVSALTERTEGWVAALQLAGLSVQGRDDAAGFIASFAGDDRYVIDYLAEEVLERQPPATRAFLLESSILDRLSGPVCDAVTGQADGQTTLERLERANLFVIPLDDRREWYRYHHLFADVLRARLRVEAPSRVVDLHQRASAWYERHHHITEAIHHAMAAGDHARAAGMIERAMPALTQARQEVLLRRLLEALPADVRRSRPVLAVGYVGALMQTGQFEGVQALLDEAEGDFARAPRGSSADDAGLHRLPGTIAMYRSALALAGGDLATTIASAERGLEALEPADHFRRGALLSIQGLARWTSGDLDEAHRLFGEGMDSLGRAGYASDVVGGMVTLADIRIAQGRLEDAVDHYERGLSLARRGGVPPLRGAADMHTGLAAIAYERDQLDDAARHLREGQELGELNGLPKNPWRWRAMAARLRHAEGDLPAALELFAEAEQRYAGDFSPEVHPVAAQRARLWIVNGHLADARRWASSRGLSAADEPTYVSMFEHATLVRLLVAEGRQSGSRQALTEAIGLADRLRDAAASAGWRGAELDVLVASALARDAIGDGGAAMSTISQAIEIAEPEGWVRVFADEGSPIRSLLKRLAPIADAAGLPARLLAAAAGEAGPERPGGHRLVEPLSRRELDVLRLLVTDLSGPDIASELFVSLNTLRTHTRSIYAKLGVSTRRAAVRRALELDLLRQGPERTR